MTNVDANEQQQARIATLVEKAKAEIQRRLAQRRAEAGPDDLANQTFAVPEVKFKNPVQRGHPGNLVADRRASVVILQGQAIAQAPPTVVATKETPRASHTQSGPLYRLDVGSPNQDQNRIFSITRGVEARESTEGIRKHSHDQSAHDPSASTKAEHSRHSSLASIGPIHKKRRLGSVSTEDPSTPVVRDFASPSLTSIATSPTPQNSKLPDWYTNAVKPPRPTSVERRTWDRLQELDKWITRCKELRSKPVKRETVLQSIKAELDHLTFLDVTAYGLKRARLLDNQYGLPQLFNIEYSEDEEYPWFIKTDAKILYNTWKVHKIFDGSNMFRGIRNMIKAKDVKKQGPSIDADFKIDWHYFREGYLGNGQWFAMQLCAVRDGAHGSAQGGIAGIKGEGATSIVMSGTMYEQHDRDNGDEIWYSGTPQQKTGPLEPTVGTQYLLDNEETGSPVRVLRAQNLPRSNVYRPERGMRYDGLYKVVGHECIDTRKHHYLFHLVRGSGQDPIRYQGPEVKPTKKEIEVYDTEMRKYGRRKDGT